MKNIKASEIGTFMYCNRAWSFQKAGVDSANKPGMKAGTRNHRQHLAVVHMSHYTKYAAYILIALSLAMSMAFFSGLIN